MPLQSKPAPNEACALPEKEPGDKFLATIPFFPERGVDNDCEYPTKLKQKSGDTFVDRLKEAGVFEIAFLRHGNTHPIPENGVDFDRALTDIGRKQAKQAASSFGNALKPFYPSVLVSPAPRTMETAKIFLEAAGCFNIDDKDEIDQVHLSPIQSLYAGAMQPQADPLFEKLGYAPLRDYLDDQMDEADKITARACLGAYAQSLVESILDVLNGDAAKADELAAAERPVTRRTLLVVGHAIYLPAAALGIASITNCDKDSLDLILSTNTKEAEGYLINLEQAKAQCLRRPENE